MGNIVDSIFGDNKGPSAAEQNAQAAAQSKADRDYEAKIFEERDAKAREREAEAHKNELERLRIKEQKLRQRESEETLQGLGVAGTADITLGNDDKAQVQDTNQKGRVVSQTTIKNPKYQTPEAVDTSNVAVGGPGEEGAAAVADALGTDVPEGGNDAANLTEEDWNENSYRIMDSLLGGSMNGFTINGRSLFL